MSSFQLSDPGNLMAQDPAMAEYLRAYEFPDSSKARYGFGRIPSPQESQRVSILAQAWVPGHAIGTVLVLHGYSEHAGNYSALVRELVDNNFAVITVDFRGHGLSEGPAGHADSSAAYAEDTEKVVAEIFNHVLPSRPLYIWAHSMGAMVGLQLLARGKLPVVPKAVAFTSPLLGFPELSGVQRLMGKLSPLLAKLIPALPVPHGISPSILSHDELYLARRFEDPLIKRVTTPRWFESVKVVVQELQSDAAKFQQLTPTLLMLAGNEKVTNLNSARSFAFRAYAGQVHKVIEFPGSFHELEKEPEVRKRVVSESLAWFRSHA